MQVLNTDFELMSIIFVPGKNFGETFELFSVDLDRNLFFKVGHGSGEEKGELCRIFASNFKGVVPLVFRQKFRTGVLTSSLSILLSMDI